MSGPFRNSLVTFAVAVFATSFGSASATALTRKVDGSAQATRHPNLPESTTGQKTSKFDPQACIVTVDLRNPVANNGMTYSLSGRLFIHKSAGVTNIDPKSVTATAQGAKLVFSISSAPGACHGPKKMSIDASCSFTQTNNGGKLQATVDQSIKLAGGQATTKRAFTVEAPCK